MERKARESWSAGCLPLLLAASFAAVAQSEQAPAPSGSAETASLAGTNDLQIEPQHGQTQQQEWSDRYACYNWARNQSGFDPNQPASAPAGDTASLRDQYRRAFTACLEGRGYGVRETARGGAPPVGVRPAPQPPYPPRNLETPPEPERTLRYHPITMQVDGGYTFTAGGAADNLDNGWNGGLGVTWQPAPTVPLAFRIDGSYSRFSENARGLDFASQSYGTNIDWGRENLYGGDLDAQIYLPVAPNVRGYFFGGAGWYREQTVFGRSVFGHGECSLLCGTDIFPFGSTVARSTSGWLDSWNAGFGIEFALHDPASFFVEARYQHLAPMSSDTGFVPVRFGVRF
jgi:opacity protein-like surface antigen